MGYEVNVMVQVRDNTDLASSGALVSVAANETIFPIPLTEASKDAVNMMYIGIFRQMELKVDAMAREAADKAVEQLVQHREQIERGEHPMQQGAA